jgi:hypothetical protein
MQAFYCKKRNKDGSIDENFIGTAVSDTLLQIMQANPSDPQGVPQVKTIPQVGVIWFEVQTDDDGDQILVECDQPAPSYHHPTELQALGLVSDVDIDDFVGSSDNEDLEDDETLMTGPNTTSQPQPEANV